MAGMAGVAAGGRPRGGAMRRGGTGLRAAGTLCGGLLVLLLVTTAAAQVVPPFNTARLYPTEADFTRAIQPYQQAISASPANARAQYWLGFAYLHAYRRWLVGAAPYASGYLPRAVGPLQEAIKLSPGTPDAYVALHDVYTLMGDYDRADEVIRQMLGRVRPGWLPAIPAP
jgi:tetratricopeptide (TPR) repeat protein